MVLPGFSNNFSAHVLRVMKIKRSCRDGWMAFGAVVISAPLALKSCPVAPMQTLPILFTSKTLCFHYKATWCGFLSFCDTQHHPVQPSPPQRAHIPRCHISHWTPPWTPAVPVQLCQHITSLPEMKLSPNIQPALPLAQLEAVTSGPTDGPSAILDDALSLMKFD